MAIAAPASNPASNLEMKLPSTLGAAGNVIANGTTPGTLEFVSGVRAWVTFEGNSGSGDNVSVTISDSRNVSSVTRVSDSRFQINFSLDSCHYCQPTSGTFHLLKKFLNGQC